MERGFGADFSSVRVHEDGAAEAAGAIAFTRGGQIHARPGVADPASASGREVLAHELGHVVQQREGRVRGDDGPAGLRVNRDPALERDADDRGGAALRGERGAPSTATASDGGDDAPIQALHAMLGLLDDKVVHRYGWQAFVIAIDDGNTHVTVFARDNLTSPQWKALNKAANQAREIKLAQLVAANLMVFDEFHVTVGGDKHHFYTDAGDVNMNPQHGKNEELGADSWLAANKMAKQFFDAIGVSSSLLTLDDHAKVAKKRAADRPMEVETLKFWGIH
jgi:hypothetical protein